MKKLLYFLLFLTYIACAYSTIFFLPFMYFSGIVGATGVGLGLSYSLHQEVKKHPEKQLSEYLPWGSKRDKIMVVTILLFSILVSFIPDVNWHKRPGNPLRYQLCTPLASYAYPILTKILF